MEIGRFALVGLVATATHWAIAALVLVLAPTLPLALVNLVAFCWAFAVSFFGHQRYTFRLSGRPMRFLATSLLGLAVSTAVVVVLEGLGAGKFVPITIATVVSAGIVYLVSKIWVFRRPVAS